jgi:hypothetical protein
LPHFLTRQSRLTGLFQEAAMLVDSIEERLAKAIRAINLIKLALAVDADKVDMFWEDVREAIAPLASEVHEQLYFAREALPADAKALPAPGLDEEGGETATQYESRMAADSDGAR